MNLIDILLIIIVLLAVWSGWDKGFITGGLELIGWLGGFITALLFYQYLAVLLEKHFPSLGIWTFAVSFLITLVFVRIIASLLMNLILQSIPKRVHNTTTNHILGIVPGFITGVVYAAIVSTLLLVMPMFDGLILKTRDSKLANKLSTPSAWLESKLSFVFDDGVKHSINRLIVAPKSEKVIKLPFKVVETKIRKDLEAEMLILINQERLKEGLKQLKADPEAAEVARKHSQDMFTRSYFSHISPEGNDPFFRMRKGGLKFLTAGENLALAQTLPIAHKGLMDSPGHRANILHKAFGRVGIGILDGGIYGLMITQNFRN